MNPIVNGLLILFVTMDKKIFPEIKSTTTLRLLFVFHDYTAVWCVYSSRSYPPVCLPFVIFNLLALHVKQVVLDYEMKHSLYSKLYCKQYIIQLRFGTKCDGSLAHRVSLLYHLRS